MEEKVTLLATGEVLHAYDPLDPEVISTYQSLLEIGEHPTIHTVPVLWFVTLLERAHHDMPSLTVIDHRLIK